MATDWGEGWCFLDGFDARAGGVPDKKKEKNEIECNGTSGEKGKT